MVGTKIFTGRWDAYRGPVYFQKWSTAYKSNKPVVWFGTCFWEKAPRFDPFELPGVMKALRDHFQLEPSLVTEPLE